MGLHPFWRIASYVRRKWHWSTHLSHHMLSFNKGAHACEFIVVVRVVLCHVVQQLLMTPIYMLIIEVDGLFRITCVLENSCMVVEFAQHVVAHDVMVCASDEYSAGSRSLPALTSMDRTAWATCRNRHFSSGVNKDSLHVVESAIFHVILLLQISELLDAHLLLSPSNFSTY